ncbi:MAG TPA: branched-chain amino acid ABC transporter permease [Candidatus Methylomirabilis sp.]|jgi:branched-chain amino acid transport system permease protein
MVAAARRPAGLAVAVLALLALPHVLPAYYLSLGTQVLFYAIFAMSLDLLVGYTGLTSLGHASFFGVAAYAIALLGGRGVTNLLLVASVALLAAALFAAVFGLLAIRGSALGFLMITLALGQVLWGLAFRWAAVTGGDNGLAGITRPALPFGISLHSGEAFYYFTLAAFAAVGAVLRLVVRSPFGLVLIGIREQPTRMRALGFHVKAYQYVTFVIAGSFAGVGGILYAYFNAFVHPTILNLTTSAEALLMVIAGGAGTLAGPVAGAALVVLLKNVASAYLERWVILLGAIYAIIVLFAPGGLAAAWRAVAARWFAREGIAPAEAGAGVEPGAGEAPSWVEAGSRPPE